MRRSEKSRGKENGSGKSEGGRGKVSIADCRIRIADFGFQIADCGKRKKVRRAEDEKVRVVRSGLTALRSAALDERFTGGALRFKDKMIRCLYFESTNHRIN